MRVTSKHSRAKLWNSFLEAKLLRLPYLPHKQRKYGRVYRRTAWEIYTSAATNVTLRLDCLQLLGFAVFARIILCPGCVLSGVVIATRVLFANRSIARETRAHRFSRYVILRIMLKADCVYFSFNCGLNSSKGIRGRDLRAPVSIRDR